MKNIYSVLLTLALLVSLSSCSYQVRGDGGKDGKIAMAIYKERKCAILVSFTNLTYFQIFPKISFIAYDSSGNTIGKKTVYFDKAFPDKQQMKSVSFGDNKCAIGRIKVESATVVSSSGTYLPLIGVDGEIFYISRVRID